MVRFIQDTSDPESKRASIGVPYKCTRMYGRGLYFIRLWFRTEGCFAVPRSAWHFPAVDGILVFTYRLFRIENRIVFVAGDNFGVCAPSAYTANSIQRRYIQWRWSEFWWSVVWLASGRFSVVALYLRFLLPISPVRLMCGCSLVWCTAWGRVICFHRPGLSVRVARILPLVASLWPKLLRTVKRSRWAVVACVEFPVSIGTNTYMEKIARGTR